MSYNFIWDLDGTLTDSYKVVVENIQRLLAERKIEISDDEIKTIVIRHTVGHFFRYLQENYGVDAKEFDDEYWTLSQSNYTEIGLCEGVSETLKKLSDMGCRHFILTNRNDLTNNMIKNLGIDGYFDEVVTASYGFPMKPAPDGVLYLIDKYNLDKSKTFFVGDRLLDIKAGENAGINTILYHNTVGIFEPLGTETFVVKSMIEIPGRMIDFSLGK